MSFTESLKVEIESVFDSVGFKKLDQQLKKTKAQLAGMNSLMARARGISNMREQSKDLQRRLDRTAFSFQKVDDSVRNMSVSQLTQGFGGFNGELRNNRDLAARAKQQIDELGGVIRNSEGNIARMGNVVEALSSQFDTNLGDLGLSENVGATNKELEKLQVRSNSVREAFSGGLFGEKTGRGMSGFDPGRFSMPSVGSLGIGVAAESLGVLQGEAGGVKKAMPNTTMDKFRNIAQKTSGTISGSMVPSLQSLQMTLLGVQFQLLSLAFIFGGLMGSALGAAGVFQILGNTLKQFFLPFALTMIPVALDIREALLGIGTETRKTIGRIFGLVAAFAAIGSLLAFTLNGFLSVLTVVKGLFTPITALISLLSGGGGLGSSLMTVITFLSSAGSTGAGLAGTMGVLSGAVSTAAGFLTTLGSALLGIAPPVLIAAGLIAGLFTIFQRFPGLFSAIMKPLGNLFGFMVAWISQTLKTIITVLKGIMNVFTGVITLAAGLLTGQFGKAKKGLQEIFFGLGQILIKPFVFMLNFITQTILPGIVDFATKIPKLIVKGIMALGGVFSNALKSVLPDWLWDMVKGHVEGAAELGQSALDILDMPNQLVEGIDPIEAPSIGKDFKPENNQQANGPQQQNNTFNVEAIMQGNNETPQETGRRMGEGMAEGFKNRRNSIFSNGT